MKLPSSNQQAHEWNSRARYGHQSLQCLISMGLVSSALMMVMCARTIAATAGGKMSSSQPLPQVKQPVVVSERVGLALTIYNQNIALVKDMRRAVVPQGEVILEFPNVARNVDFSSVEVASISAPTALRILMQQFLMQRPTPQALLEKHLGKTITIVRYAEDGSIAEKIDGELLAVENGRPSAVKADDKVYLHPQGLVILPQLPDEMVIEPRLLVRAISTEARSHNLLLSYITSGINWSADYTALLSPDEREMDLYGYAHIRNNSGIAFPHARIRLVAGALRISTPTARRAPSAVGLGGMGGWGAPTAAQRRFFEYHVYDVERKVTLDEGESIRLLLIAARNVSVTKDLIAIAPAVGFNSGAVRVERVPVRVVVQFVNDEEHKLGQPLPSGRVRLYKPDANGDPLLIGETPITHTGKGQKVEWEVGTAFDIGVQWRQARRKTITAREREVSIEAIIANGKDEEVIVHLRQSFPGNLDWEVITSSHPYTKRDASTAEFSVSIPPHGSVTASFTIRLRHASK